MTPPPPTQRISRHASGSAPVWLLTCHGCGTMVEVPDATAGIIYTCGTCGITMEVVDGERGITRPPPPPATVLVPPAVQPPSTPTPDTLLPGYTVTATLDADVHGRRFRVRAPDGKTFRALVLAPELVADPDFAARCGPVGESLRQIHCPYIVPVERRLTVGDTLVYLSYDPPGAEPLSAILARDHLLAQHVALAIIRQLAAALDEAASQGLSHGWLRPEVVLINPDGSLLLDELGVPTPATFLLPRLKSLIGDTGYHLAPDHLDPHRPGDTRADIFMLGALFFRMITGETLVTGPTARAALTTLIAQGIPTLGSRKPGVHATIEQFFTSLTALDHGQRCSRFFEIVDRCRNLDGSTRRIARPPGTPAAGVMPPRTPLAGFPLGAIKTGRPGTSEITKVGTREIVRPGTTEIPGRGTRSLHRPGTSPTDQIGTRATRRIAAGDLHGVGTGAIATPGTSIVPRVTTTRRQPATGAHSRRQASSPPSAALRRRDQGHGTGLLIAVVLLILAAIAVTWYVIRTLGGA